jgi:hypothetical protein
MDVFTQTLDIHAPVKTVSIPYKAIIREAWMSNGLLKSSRMRDKLYKKCLGKCKTDQIYLQYVTYRNIFNSLKRTAKEAYYTKLLDKHKFDIRKTWNTIISIIGRTRDKSFLSDIFVVNGKRETDTIKIANSFCEYFTNVGKTYANLIPNAQRSVQSYMDSNSVQQSMFFGPSDSEEIRNIHSQQRRVLVMTG